MKARITCDKNHPLGKLFENFFELEYFSRSTDFDLCDYSNLKSFIDNTPKYDWTINLSRGMPFGGTNLLCGIENFCDQNQVEHKIFNIGSYISMVLLNMTNSSYDIEKASLKYAHRKIVYEKTFHSKLLDSYLLNVYHVEELSKDAKENYPHLNMVSLESVKQNIKFMLNNPQIKELSLQFKEPGNHRLNDGIGPVLPGFF